MKNVPPSQTCSVRSMTPFFSSSVKARYLMKNCDKDFADNPKDRDMSLSSVFGKAPEAVKTCFPSESALLFVM